MGILVLLALVAFMVVVVGVIIFMERGQRRIPVQYAKRVVGRRMYGGQSSHLPLKINTAGVIPPIFASSLLVFPGTIASFVDHPWARAAAEYLMPGGCALRPAVRRADHLLLLLLHGGHLQHDRRRRQHEEVRRLHSRHPARASAPPSTSTASWRASRWAARSTSRPSASCRRS